MIDPRTVYVIHQEKVQKLERDAAFARAISERREAGLALEPQPAWYARAAQWMQTKLSFGQHAAQPEVVEAPCPTVPC